MNPDHPPVATPSSPALRAEAPGDPSGGCLAGGRQKAALPRSLPTFLASIVVGGERLPANGAPGQRLPRLTEPARRLRSPPTLRDRPEPCASPRRPPAEARGFMASVMRGGWWEGPGRSSPRPVITRKRKKKKTKQSSELTPLSDLKLTSAAFSPRACRAAGLPWCAAGARGKPQA